MQNELEFKLKEKMAALESALLNAHPLLPNLIREILKVVKSYPEQVTIMTSEELNSLFKGLETVHKIKLQEAVTTKKSTSAKKALEKALDAGMVEI